MNEFNVVGVGKVEVGQSCSIHSSAQIVFNEPATVTVGDYCNIGPNVKIICLGGNVSIGDWTTLHDNCLVLSQSYVTVGQHCWFGQNCVIDGTGGLKIGRGVRVGMYSQIWSHVAAGEQIEGCTLYGEREVNIEDNVWLVGSCIVSSGVTIGQKTVALSGSNITKSFSANSTIAGSPALLKPTLSFYKEMTLEEKWGLISEWMQCAITLLNVDILNVDADLMILTSSVEEGSVLFARTIASATKARLDKPNSTVCCIEDKSYNKQFTPLEMRVLKYLGGNKARFYSE